MGMIDSIASMMYFYMMPDALPTPPSLTVAPLSAKTSTNIIDIHREDNAEGKAIYFEMVSIAISCHCHDILGVGLLSSFLSPNKVLGHKFLGEKCSVFQLGEGS
jgi:hypothetical protein